MKCNRCGEEILDTNKFCTECGNQLVNYNFIGVNNKEIEVKDREIKVDDNEIDVNDNEIEVKRFKSKTNGIVNLIFFITTSLFIVGIVLFVKLGGYEKDDTNKATASTNENSKKDKFKTKDLVISEEDATERVTKISCNNDIILKSKGVAISKEITGADELIGKKCYYFGFKEGNSIIYVFNSENGDIYECISKSAGVLTVIRAQQKTNSDNTNVLN